MCHLPIVMCLISCQDRQAPAPRRSPAGDLPKRPASSTFMHGMTEPLALSTSPYFEVLDATEDGLPATTTIEVRVSALGAVEEVTVVPPSSGIADAALVEEVRRWTYYPALENGRPVTRVVRHVVGLVFTYDPSFKLPFGRQPNPADIGAPDLIYGVGRVPYLQ